MKQNTEYTPFGPEWEMEMKKFNKNELIQHLRTAFMKLKTRSEEPVSAPSVPDGSWKIREIEHKCHPESGDLSVDIETVISDDAVSLSCRDVEDTKLQNLVNALNDCQTVFSFDSDNYAEARIENYKLSEEIRRLQSEGGLQWVKVVDEFPGHAQSVLTEDFAGHYKMMEYNGPPDWWKRNIKRWLKKSSSPSTANTEEERLNKEITGFDTVAERVAYDEGYSANQKVMMQWIEKWDGSTNSGLGELLDRKFKELNTEEGAEPATREQQIAFAEWILKNEWNQRSGIDWAKYMTIYSDVSVLTTSELYELFLETKQQQP